MKKIIASVVILAMLVGCASAPTGPTVMVMPRAGQDFKQFKADNEECKQYASDEAEKTSNASFKNGAATTGVLMGIGALAGLLLMGGRSVNVGTGAGAGLIAGGLAGSLGQNKKEDQAQAQYNMAFQQCMFAKGNAVTGATVK